MATFFRRATIRQRKPRFVPSKVAASSVTVTPSTLALTLTNFSPTVSTPRLVTPSTTALALTGFAPAALAPRAATPTTAGLTLTTFAPTILAPRVATPSTAALALSAFAPTVQAPRVATPPPAALALTGYAPDVTATTTEPGEESGGGTIASIPQRRTVRPAPIKPKPILAAEAPAPKFSLRLRLLFPTIETGLAAEAPPLLRRLFLPCPGLQTGSSLESEPIRAVEWAERRQRLRSLAELEDWVITGV